MRLARPFPVGIVEAQDEAAPILPCPQPVVDGGPDVADMEPSRRRGGEAGDDVHGGAVGCGSERGNAVPILAAREARVEDEALVITLLAPMNCQRPFCRRLFPLS